MDTEISECKNKMKNYETLSFFNSFICTHPGSEERPTLGLFTLTKTSRRSFGEYTGRKRLRSERKINLHTYKY